MDTHAPPERPDPQQPPAGSPAVPPLAGSAVVSPVPAPRRPPLAKWLARLAVAAWLLSIALWVQFTLASVEEKEPQAIALGAVIAVMLLVVGLTLWVARRHTVDR